MALLLKKAKMMELPRYDKSDDRFSRLDTIHECDRQTDRQTDRRTDTGRTLVSRLCIASRDRKTLLWAFSFAIYHMCS